MSSARLYALLLLLALGMEALFLRLLWLGDLRQHVVETILLLLLSSPFYLTAVFYTLHAPSSLALRPSHLLLPAVLFRLTLWPLFPALSDDPFRYRWEGRLQLAGGNPYQVCPDDPDYRRLRDATYPAVVLKEFKAGYGPLLELQQRATAWLLDRLVRDPHAQVFWFKLPAALADLGCLWALHALLRRHGLSSAPVIVYAWCPLPIVEFWATGHHDSLVLLPLLLAFLAASRARWPVAFACLSVAVLGKWWPALLVPLFLRAAGRRWPAALVGLPLAALAFLPYWSDLHENAEFMSGFLGGWRNNDSLFALTLWLSSNDPYRAKYATTALITLSTLAIAVVGQTPVVPPDRQGLTPASSSPSSLVPRALWTLALTLLLSANVHPWYLTWLVPFLAFSPQPALLLWVCLCPLFYEPLLAWTTLGTWNGVTPLRWLVYAPVFALLAARLLTVRNSLPPWRRPTVVMRCLTPIALLLAASAAYGQQLSWRGEVDGSVNLRVYGERVEVVERTGTRVTQPDFRFTERLPRVQQDVRVEVRQGRGRVRVLEQPSANNRYTLTVSIDDRGAGASFYDLAFYYNGDRFSSGTGGTGTTGGVFDGIGDDRNTRARDRYPLGNDNRAGRVRRGGQGGIAYWSGRVDDEAVVEFSRRNAYTRTIRGAQVYGERAEFDGNLPRRPVQVSVTDVRGRGEIRLIEQPNAGNNFTAKVLVRDRDGGASDYSFALQWDGAAGGLNDSVYGNNSGYGNDSGYGYNGPVGSGSLLWSGRVDGRVRVAIAGQRADVQVLSGAPVQNSRVDLRGGGIGRQTLSNVQIRRVSGRDPVRLLEQPSPNNGYRVVFEIDDNDGGSDDYQVEITW